MSTLLAALVLAPQGGLACPVMGSPANDKSGAVDYAGVRYTFCCAGCDQTFAKEPAKYLKSEKVKAKTLGVSLFDPVNGRRVDAKTAKGGSADFNGVRYHFISQENRVAFEGEPKKYTQVPAKESLTCPVMGSTVASYAVAPAYADHEGVRYYLCCDGCIAPFEKDPAQFAKNASGKATAPKAQKVKQ
ncbi:MAG TPA: YHS domain-containing protein [Fimbriimonadaceae bacterium]|nr:YHS domain-containing protein [Fimbriimonadaceae bacterium]